MGRNRFNDPEVAAIVVNSRDITDRRQTEESLRESEKRMTTERNHATAISAIAITMAKPAPPLPRSLSLFEREEPRE